MGLEAPVGSHVAQVRIRRGQNELTKLVEIKSLIVSAVIDPDDLLGILLVRAQEMLVHELHEFDGRDLLAVVDVEELVETEWLKVWISGKILPTLFNLKRANKLEVSVNDELISRPVNILHMSIPNKKGKLPK